MAGISSKNVSILSCKMDFVVEKFTLQRKRKIADEEENWLKKRIFTVVPFERCKELYLSESDSIIDHKVICARNEQLCQVSNVYSPPGGLL